MDIPLIISIIALLLAVFAVFKVMTASSVLSARIERLKDKNSILENRLNDYNGNVNRNTGNRNSRQPNAANEPVAFKKEPNPQRQERQQRPPREQQPQSSQQRPPREQQPQPKQQPSQPKQQPPQQRQQPSQAGQPQQPRQQQAPQQQAPQQPGQQQPKKKKENPRRNEPTEKKYPDQEQPRNRELSLEELVEASTIVEEFDNQERVSQPAKQQEEFAEKKYAIIPEDGLIRQHQLQLQPDSDSYLEVDMPAYGKSNVTRYRFNLSGNHAFVIAQGIDRLENAFSFEKPSNRKVSQVVLREDGVLAKVDNGWKIQQKAKIDFR